MSNEKAETDQDDRRLDNLCAARNKRLGDHDFAVEVIGLARERLAGNGDRLWGLMTCVLDQFVFDRGRLEDELAYTKTRLAECRTGRHCQRQELESLTRKLDRIRMEKGGV